MESESNLQDLVLSSHHVVPTQVINSGSKCLYQLRAISLAPNCFFFFLLVLVSFGTLYAGLKLRDPECWDC